MPRGYSNDGSKLNPTSKNAFPSTPTFVTRIAKFPASSCGPRLLMSITASAA